MGSSCGDWIGSLGGVMTSLMGIVNWPYLLRHVCGGAAGLYLHLSRVLMVGLEHPRVWKVTMVQPSLEVSLVDC